MKVCPHKDWYPMLIEALFTTAPKWKQPKCPPANECVTKGEILPGNKKKHATT